MDFESFVKDITDNKWNVFGVEVYKDGKLLHCFGDTEENIHDIYSATKTILSVALGIAIDKGIIDIDKCIPDYLPKDYTDNMKAASKEAFGKISVRRLMTMSVGGFPFRPEGDNWLKSVLELEPQEAEVFNYSNVSAFLAGVALDTALGEDLGLFIEREIFKPLNITDYKYGRSPEGYFYGASKMKLSVHDLSKIGLLLTNGGVYEGKRILSKEYTNMATSVQQMNREGGYGFFVWKYRNGFSINGKLKQKCYCLPQEGIVITYLAHIEEDTPELKESMERYILRIV